MSGSTTSNKFIVTFNDAISHNREAIALTDYLGSNLSYGELSSGIKNLAAFWNSSGLQPGEKIAILAPNSVKWLEVYLAAVLNGYVAVLLPTNLNQDLLIEVLRQSECRFIYTSKEYSTLFQNNNIEINTWDIKSLSLIPSNIKNKATVPFDFLPPAFNISDENSVCTILYTSGSMGEPKGSMITYNNLSYNIEIVSDWMRKYQKGQNQVNFLPFSHIYGLICDALTPIFMGTKLIILGAATSTLNLLNALQKYKPCILFAIPLVIDNMIQIIENQYFDKKRDSEASKCPKFRQTVFSSLGGKLNVIITGGSPMSQELEMRLIHNLKLPFVTGYGTTECGPLSAGIVGKYQNGSCGKILDKNVVRIDKQLCSDISGEIQIKGNNVFAGYYKNDISTKASFTEDGWFKTGDLGYIDEEGTLFITGRCKDMLLTSNGENIYPAEIEETMNASPYVKESILVQRGEKIQAIIVPDWEKAKADGLEAEGLNKKIDEAVREAGKKLPGFTIISSYELRDEPLERTPKGSLKRFLYSEGIKEN